MALNVGGRPPLLPRFFRAAIWSFFFRDHRLDAPILLRTGITNSAAVAPGDGEGIGTGSFPVGGPAIGGAVE